MFGGWFNDTNNVPENAPSKSAIGWPVIVTGRQRRSKRAALCAMDAERPRLVYGRLFSSLRGLHRIARLEWRLN